LSPVPVGEMRHGLHPQDDLCLARKSAQPCHSQPNRLDGLIFFVHFVYFVVNPIVSITMISENEILFPLRSELGLRKQSRVVQNAGVDPANHHAFSTACGAPLRSR
jgi:hypothetical protein